jgi:hypothetical protein
MSLVGLEEQDDEDATVPHTQTEHEDEVSPGSVAAGRVVEENKAVQGEQDDEGDPGRDGHEGAVLQHAAADDRRHSEEHQFFRHAVEGFGLFLLGLEQQQHAEQVVAEVGEEQGYRGHDAGRVEPRDLVLVVLQLH